MRKKDDNDRTSYRAKHDARIRSLMVDATCLIYRYVLRKLRVGDKNKFPSVQWPSTAITVSVRLVLAPSSKIALSSH